VGILEWHTKDKNRQATIARPSKQMPMFIVIVSESFQNIFAVPADILRDLKAKVPENYAITQRIVSAIKSALMRSRD
jgi:hypothetical protein